MSLSHKFLQQTTPRYATRDKCDKGLAAGEAGGEISARFSTVTSHSSRAQKSARHQSPDVRHGPATLTTFPYTLLFFPRR